MNIEKRGHPVAVCTRCGRFGYQVQSINERCSAQIDNQRCQGVWAGALNLDDWKECDDCAATGRRDGFDCSNCNGSGWHYLRPRIGIFR
jgi:hypothetical protein